MSTRSSRIVRITLLALFLVAAADARAQLTPTALSPLPGDTSSLAHGINARGEVVGLSLIPGATAVVWR